MEVGRSPRCTGRREPGVALGKLAELRAQALADRRLALLVVAEDGGPRAVAEVLRAPAHPRFDRAATPRGVDDPDGDGHRFSEFSREEVTDGREAADVRWIGRGPHAAGQFAF